MAEIVNLRIARKRKQRENDKQTADHSRSLHGRTKIEKRKVEAEHIALGRHLDGHRLIKPDEK